MLCSPTTIQWSRNNPTRQAAEARPTSTFTRGLSACVSKVVVRLPGPGKTFSARERGLQWSRRVAGGGAWSFSVSVGESRRSSRRPPRGDAARARWVDLGGATELSWEVGDAATASPCDQSDWADAKVVLADAREVLARGHAIRRGEGLERPGRHSLHLRRPAILHAAPHLGAKQRAASSTTPAPEHVVTYTDPRRGLSSAASPSSIRTSRRSRWTLHFRQHGKADTPILADIQALDAQVVRGGKQEFILTTPSARRAARATMGRS